MLLPACCLSAILALAFLVSRPRRPAETRLPAPRVSEGASTFRSAVPCPSCGRLVAVQPIRCPRCGEPQVGSPAQAVPRWVSTMLFALAALVLGFLSAAMNARLFGSN